MEACNPQTAIAGIECRPSRRRDGIFAKERSHADTEPADPQIEQFLPRQSAGVLTSFRRNGMPQLSIVTVYPRTVGWAYPSRKTRAKFKTSCGIPAALCWCRTSIGGGFLVFEGKAELAHSGNTDPEPLRLARRHIF